MFFRYEAKEPNLFGRSVSEAGIVNLRRFSSVVARPLLRLFSFSDSSSFYRLDGFCDRQSVDG